MLLLAVCLIVLTRTQFGRDALRSQIERSFDRAFDGSLAIGRLQGNIIQDLFASDIRLFDPDGNEIVRIDSVAMRPHWRSLFVGAFVADDVEIFRPVVRLVRDEQGSWNIAEALASSRPREGPSDPIDFRSASLRIVDGAISTADLGSQAASGEAGAAFDYTNASVTGLSAELALDWRDRIQLLSISSFRAALGDDALVVESLETRLAIAEGNIQAEDFNLVTSRSRVRGSIALSGLSRGLEEVDINIIASRVAAADVTVFLPGLQVADAIGLQGRLSGPIRQLALDDFVVRRGETEVLAAGTVRGVPDSLAFDVTTPGTRIGHEDLAALIPGVRLPDEVIRLGTMEFAGQIAGSVPFRSAGGVRIEGEGTLVSDAGRWEGAAEWRARQGLPARFEMDADIVDLNPAIVLGDQRFAGSLSGSVFVERQGRERAPVAFRIALGGSLIAGRVVDSLSAEGEWNGSALDASVGLRQGLSRLNGALFLDATDRALSFDGQLDEFDANLLFSEAPVSRFTGPISLTALGSSIERIEVDIGADFSSSSLVVDGTRHQLPDGPLRVRVSPVGTPGPRFALTTGIIDVDLKGELDVESFIALGARWGSGLVSSIASTTNKPLRTAAHLSKAVPARNVPYRSPEAFLLNIRVLDPAALRALVPDVPDMSAGSTVVIGGMLGSDSLAFDVTASGSEIDTGPVRLGRYSLQIDGGGVFSENLAESLSIRLSANAANARISGQRLLQTSFAAGLSNGSVHYSVNGTGLFGSKANVVEAAGSLAFLPDRNRLTIDSLRVQTVGISWGSEGPILADLYSDAAVLERVALTQFDTEAAEHVLLSGVLSASPADTVFVDVRDVDLRKLARLGSIRPLRSEPGGTLSGRLAVVNMLRRPGISGAVYIPELMLGNRILGRLDATSRLTPSGDGINLDLVLGLPDTSIVLERGEFLEENEIGIGGTVRFPGRDDTGARDAGAFDLALDVRRADLFIFDLIFPHLLERSNGAASGDGRIRGDFSFPEFNARLAVENGRTSIPSFGLEFGLDGDVEVDQRGIHLTEVHVSDKAGGTADVSGSVLFNDYRYFSLDLSAQLRGVEIIDVPSSTNLPFYGHIQASGSATVTGPLDNVFLQSTDAVTLPGSEIFIPIRAGAIARDRGFMVYADSLGRIPEEQVRTNLVTGKPENERSFVEGLEMSLNLTAPPGSEVHLVFDEARDDVINAEGSAALQLSIREGRFTTFGTFMASGGDYLFTAGDVFTRRFDIEPNGVLIWDGNPLDAQIDLTADYRTRASLAGLGLAGLEQQRVPLVVRTGIGGRLSAPLINLSLELDADQRTGGGSSAAVEALRPILNNTGQQALYASSVLLTGTFLLAPVENLAAAGSDAITGAADELLFTSLSQLVSSRVNLFLSHALASENVEILFGLQPVDALQRFDLTYGVALRLLDERLIIRGEGVYQQYENQPSGGELQGELAIEVRLSNSVALEVFYRRESDLLGSVGVGTAQYGAYGVGVGFQREFTNWRSVLRGILGREPVSTGAAE